MKRTKKNPNVIIEQNPTRTSGKINLTHSRKTNKIFFLCQVFGRLKNWCIRIQIRPRPQCGHIWCWEAEMSGRISREDGSLHVLHWNTKKVQNPAGEKSLMEKYKQKTK